MRSPTSDTEHVRGWKHVWDRNSDRSTFDGSEEWIHPAPWKALPMWRFSESEDGEAVVAVAPVIVGSSNDFTHRLLLTDRRIVLVRSPAVASMFGFARYVTSRTISSMRLEDIRTTRFTSSAGGFFTSISIEGRDGLRTFRATGIASRWLRLLAVQLPNSAG